MAAAAVGNTRDSRLAICRLVEETSGHETVRYFGPGCLVKFDSTEFLHSVGTPKSKYFVVASNQVLRRDILETLQKQETKEKSTKKREPSVRMVAEFPGKKIGESLERKPLNELYSNLEEDVLELDGITYLAVTKPKLQPGLLRKSTLLSRALEGNVSSLMTSDQLQCVVLCSERTIDRRDKDPLSAKVYDLLQRDSVLAHDREESQCPSYFLRNEEKRRFLGEDEFRNLDGKPLGSIILNRDGKFVGVLNFIKNQPAPAVVGGGQFKPAASEKHDDVTETEKPVGASGGIYPLLDPQSKSKVETGPEMSKVAEPVVTPPTRNQFVAGLTGSNRADINSVDPGTVAEGESKLEEKQDPDHSNGKQSPIENSYRSEKGNSYRFLQFSSSNEAEAKQDLKGRVYMVNLPPENGSKEEPGPVDDDQRVQANNNEGEPSVEVPAVNLGDQVDDQSVQRRNNNEPPAKAPGGETGGKRADKEENLPQDRSRDGSPQDRGIERRASFPPDLPQKDVHPQMNRSVSVFNQLQHAGRQRKLQLDDLLTKSLLDSLELLEELSRCLDQEYRYGRCKCWKHIAEFFDIPENDYQNFKCNKVHSPTEILFEFLKSDSPDITVGMLKHGLAQIERKDVIDILIKHEKCHESARSLNDDTFVCSLFDSDPDIIGEMAFLLDKQKMGLKDWADLAAKLGVPRTIFTSFETCSTDNPTEQLFDIVKARFPRLTVGKLIDHLNAINRRDVILAIKKSTTVKEDSFIKELIADIDVMDEVCELLNKKQRTTKVPGLKRLGHRLKIEKEILDDLLPTQEETVSPTEALVRHLGGRKPYLTLAEFIWALHAIERSDALDTLNVYMSDGCISNLLKSCPCERCKQARLSGEGQW